MAAKTLALFAVAVFTAVSWAAPVPPPKPPVPQLRVAFLRVVKRENKRADVAGVYLRVTNLGRGEWRRTGGQKDIPGGCQVKDADGHVYECFLCFRSAAIAPGGDDDFLFIYPVPSPGKVKGEFPLKGITGGEGTVKVEFDWPPKGR